MISAIMEYQFLQNAVLASILASIVCGIIGVIIVEKRLLMMSGGIAHTALGGVGLGYLLGFEPILGAAGFAVLAALGIGSMRKKGGQYTDVVIALFWSVGMALGIVFIAITPGYPPDITTYLFGNILTVTRSNLKLMGIMTLIVVLVITIFYADWKSYLFDEEFAYLNGLAVTVLEYTLLILIALTVVSLIRVVGIVLVIALLSAPAATAALFSNKLKTRMIYAIFIGLINCFIGLWISYEWNIASGAAIVIVSVVVFLISYITVNYVLKKHLAS